MLFEEHAAIIGLHYARITGLCKQLVEQRDQLVLEPCPDREHESLFPARQDFGLVWRRGVRMRALGVFQEFCLEQRASVASRRGLAPAREAARKSAAASPAPDRRRSNGSRKSR